MIKAYLIKLVTVVQNVDGSVKVLMWSKACNLNRHMVAKLLTVVLPQLTVVLLQALPYSQPVVRGNCIHWQIISCLACSSRKRFAFRSWYCI